MTKIILISAIAATGLFADMATDLITSQAKSAVEKEVAKQVTGNDTEKKETAVEVSDKSKEVNASEEKSEKVESTTDALKNTATEQAKDAAIDTAAGEAEKAVGNELLNKDTAKSAIKSVL